MILFKKNINELRMSSTRPSARKLVSSKCAPLETIQLRLETSFATCNDNRIQMATYGDPSCIHHSRRILTRIQTNVHKHTRVQIQFYRCAKSDVSLFSWTRFASNKLLIYINGIGSTFEIKVRDDHVCHDLGTVLNSRSERHQSSFSNHSSRIFPFFFFFFFFLHELETRTDVESFRLQLRWMCIRTNCLSSVYVRIDRSRWLRILTTGFVSP